MGYDTVYFGHDLTFYFIESLYFDNEPYVRNGKHHEPKNEVTCIKTAGKAIAQILNLEMV